MNKFFCLIFVVVSFLNSYSQTIDNHIKIDQFGYRAIDKKVAVISKASVGFNAPDAFVPSTAANQYQVRRVSDNVAVFTGTLWAWNAGNVDASGQTGDFAWWFDFSSVNQDGDYYVYDVGLNKKSYNFKIGNDVYAAVAKQAVKTLYYQRCGVAKTVAFGGIWNDIACHNHSEQDLDCRSASNPIAATSKDLSGGWHDAGDYNKYVNFALPAVDGLLNAYEEKPMFWGDDSNIPESGNGFPDILDELKFELDWLLKMQQSNGSVLSKVSVMSYTEGSPASSSTVARRYAPVNTTSALSFAAMLAHASMVYRAFPVMQTYANTLRTAAINAYSWALANPNVTFSNAGYASADVDGLLGTYERNTALKLTAAVYLYALTENADYKTFIESNYTNMHLLAWTYAYEYEGTYQDALLYYANLPSATAAVATAIKNAYKSSINTSSDNLPKYTANTDAYRAYMSYHTFNSNHFKAFKGQMYQNAIKYQLNTANNQTYRDASLSFVNYLHGVNPLAKNYLSNASSLGAENSVNEIYHTWFGDGTIYDGTVSPKIGAPPAFLVCGSDQDYLSDGGNAARIPPAGQPTQKSYLDFNTVSDASWVTSEIAIYNQATYTRLLQNYITQNTALTGVTYCLPVSLSGGVALSSFTLNGKVLSQNSGFGENGYQIFTSTVSVLNAGTSYSFSTQKSASTAHTETIWIDLNRDGDFEDSGEQVVSASLNTNANSGTFVLPASGSAGYTRMRVRVSAIASTACASGSTDGETEDYVIEMVACPATVYVNGLVTPGPFTTNQVIKASNDIIVGNSSNPLNINASNSNNLRLSAGKSITFGNGISISSGATFKAEIGGCNVVMPPYNVQKISYQYGTDPNGTALIVDVYQPSVATASSRKPLIIFTHGTGGSESNPHGSGTHAMAQNLAANQGFVAAYFNFFGSDNTRLQDDELHLLANYNAVITYLQNNAATYGVNPNAIILHGTSGSAAGAMSVAIKKGMFGCIVEAGGRNVGIEYYEPASLATVVSVAGVQSQSDVGFGGYRYNTADVRSGASHNYNAWTENTALAVVPWPGQQGYCTAWNDCSLNESYNYYLGKYSATYIKQYSLIVAGQSHGPDASTQTQWDAFMQNTPKQMLNDRGVTW